MDKIKGQRQPTKSLPLKGNDKEYSSIYLEEQKIYMEFLNRYGHGGTFKDYLEFTGQEKK